MVIVEYDSIAYRLKLILSNHGETYLDFFLIDL